MTIQPYFGNYSKDTLQCNYSHSLDVLMESIINFSPSRRSAIFGPSLEKN